MNEVLEILKLLISFKDSPLLFLGLLTICALALAGLAIYALIVALKQLQGDK